MALRHGQGKTGLSGNFTVRSVGEALFEENTDAGWKLMKRGRAHGLKVRYLGCTQGDESFELRWELKHGGQRILLRERVSTKADREVAVWRELKVEGLYAGEALQVPIEVAAVWRSTTGSATAAFAGGRWIRFVIP